MKHSSSSRDDDNNDNMIILIIIINSTLFSHISIFSLNENIENI